MHREALFVPAVAAAVASLMASPSATAGVVAGTPKLAVGDVIDGSAMVLVAPASGTGLV